VVMFTFCGGKDPSTYCENRFTTHVEKSLYIYDFSTCVVTATC
jgi:hypothetical protein